MGDPEVIATGKERVREYLLGLGMPEPDIRLYLDEAQQGPGPATFSFGSDDEGLIPDFQLSCDASEYVLAKVQP